MILKIFNFTGVTILLLLIPSLFLVKGAPLKGKWQNAVPWSVLDLYISLTKPGWQTAVPWSLLDLYVSLTKHCWEVKRQ